MDDKRSIGEAIYYLYQELSLVISMYTKLIGFSKKMELHSKIDPVQLQVLIESALSDLGPLYLGWDRRHKQLSELNRECSESIRYIEQTMRRIKAMHQTLNLWTSIEKLLRMIFLSEMSLTRQMSKMRLFGESIQEDFAPLIISGARRGEEIKKFLEREEGYSIELQRQYAIPSGGM